MNDPQCCEHSVKELTMSADKVKTLCNLRETHVWTNCREVGHCTLCNTEHIGEGGGHVETKEDR